MKNFFERHLTLFALSIDAAIVAGIFWLAAAISPPPASPAPAAAPCVTYGRLKVCTLPDGTRCAMTGDSRGGIDCDWAPAVAEKK